MKMLRENVSNLILVVILAVSATSLNAQDPKARLPIFKSCQAAKDSAKVDFRKGLMKYYTHEPMDTNSNNKKLFDSLASTYGIKVIYTNDYSSQCYNLIIDKSITDSLKLPYTFWVHLNLQYDDLKREADSK